MKLIGIIKSKTREKILRFFFTNKEKKYYLRELERILKLPVGNIRRELISLEKLGLFKRKKIGNLVYYFLNKDSSFFEVVENMILKTEKKKKISNKELKNNESTNLLVIKKNDLDLLYSKINELQDVLEVISERKSEFEDFLNLGVVVNKNKQVLLAKRVKKEKGMDGAFLTWVFSGAKQRLNESRSECVVRGVLAETGYKVKPIKEISFRYHPQFSVFIVYHLCELTLSKPVAKPKQSYEIAQNKWVKPKDIKKFLTTDIDPAVSREIGLI